MLLPDAIAKSGSEDAIQTALFAFIAMVALFGFKASYEWAETGVVPTVRLPIIGLRWMHHIPNGGSRGSDARSAQITGARLKAAGVKSGISDILLPMRNKTFGGLYLEMKNAKGVLSASQVEFGEFVTSQNYQFATARTWREAARIIETYLEN